MDQKIFMDKYHIFSHEILKQNAKYKTVDDVCNFLISKINNEPKAAFIGFFDHYTHTIKIGGTISDDIKDAKIVVFCFGQMLTNPDITAIRPRSFGVVDIGDKIVVNFQEPPMPALRDVMIEWASEL